MNLSAEAADPPSFFSFEFFDAVVPLGAPDPWFGTTAGGDSCTSVISQQDADDCALRRIENDVWGTWPENGRGGPAIQIFSNNAVQCQIDCGEGFDPFIYTVPAGTVIARTQEEADALAASYCLNRARPNKVCVPSKSIELVDLDNMYDLADTAPVIAGDLGSFPAVHRNGSTTLLPVLAATNAGAAFAVNGDGSKLTGDCNVGINGHGVWWDESSVHDLPTLAGSFSIGDSISDDGFIWTPGNALYNPNTNSYVAYPGLGSPRYAARTSRTMNNAHTVCASTAAGARDLYRYTSSALTVITPAGATNSLSNLPVSINESGHIVGKYVIGGFIHSFYNPSGGSGSSVDLGLLAAGKAVRVEALSGNDLAVGSGENAANNTVPFKWNGSISQLPMLSGTTTGAAHDCNDYGDIVGEMGTKAFLNRNGVTYDLYTLIPDSKKGAGQWTSLEQALFVNNGKYIAGFGTYNGVTRGYLLRLP